MRALLLTPALFLAAIPAAPALAQQAPAGAASGLRYLSWPGKPAVTTPAPSQARSQPADGLRPALPVQEAAAAAPSPPSTYSFTPAPVRMASTGLTPASNWLSPPAAAASSQPNAYGPPPAAYVPPAPQPIPQPTPQPNPVLNPASAPAATPSTRLVQPAPVAAPPSARLVEPAPAALQPASQQPAGPQRAAEAPVADPMAPRRDAPIFRMGAQPQPQAQVETAQTYQTAQAAPAAGSARYYSVHRPLGRTPDPAPQPQPVYLDSLPVELISPPQSADLAEPQAGPALIRNQNGSVRAAVAASDGDHE